MLVSPNLRATFPQAQTYSSRTTVRHTTPSFTGTCLPFPKKFPKLKDLFTLSGGKKTKTVLQTSTPVEETKTIPNIFTAQGITPLTQVAHKFAKAPSALTFRDYLAQHNIKYLGALPTPFQNTGLTYTQTLETMDNLAKALRYIDGHISPTEKAGLGTQGLNLPVFTFRLGNKDVRVTKAGVGAVGHVYRLEVDGKKYALKVFNDPERIDIHGAYSEIGLYTYLSKFPIRNILKLHCACPQEQGGWAMLEWWDEEAAKGMRHRAGNRDIREVLQNEGLHMTDDWEPNRGPGNMFWDLGGIAPAQQKPIKTINDFKKLLDDPRDSMDAGRRLTEVPAADLDEAIRLAIHHPASSAQTVRSGKYIANPRDVGYIIKEGLNYKESRGRAGYDINFAEDSQRKHLFDLALKYPQSAYEAAKMIDKLPRKDRFAALMQTLDLPEARGMATRHLISIISDEERQIAAQKAAQYPASRLVLRSLQGKSDDNAMQAYFKAYGVELKPYSEASIPPSQSTTQNRTIVSLDLDHSLIGPATEKSIVLLNKLHDQGKLFTVTNTGNDLSQLKKYGYGQALNGLKVDATILNDGQEIYLNDKHETQTADIWFNTLKESDKNKAWQKHIDKLGWNVPRAVDEIWSTMASAKQDPEFRDFKFYLRQDKAKFDMQGPVDELSQQRVKRLLKAIRNQLASQGIQAVGRYSISNNTYKVVFSPKDIHKAAPLNFLVGLLPNITGVVSLGDNDNDSEMLLAHTFQSKGHFATNFPILVGSFMPLKKALEKHPGAVFTTAEEVPQALETQIDSATAKPSFSITA